jgi:hypothetical protein
MTKYTKHDVNFVAPAPKPTVMEIEAVRELPSVPIIPPMPYSSHVDRSVGFSIAAAPLAAATGFVVLLIGITAFGVPLLSVAALLLALAGFAVVWLIAYIVHTFVSPDGALFLHTVFAWGYLREEARERRKRYRGVNHE